jgi:hypothetical protein
MMPHLADRIMNGVCTFCAITLDDFRDEISAKEYSISGMCQTCQDATFGVNGVDGQGEEYEETA